MAGGAAPGEGIENEVAGVGGDLQNALNQTGGFRGVESGLCPEN